MTNKTLMLNKRSAPVELTVNEYRSLVKQSPWRLLAIGARLISMDVLDELSRFGTNGLHDWNRLQAIISDERFGEFPSEWDNNYLVVATFVACTIDQSEDNFELSAKAMRRALPGLNFSSPYANIAIRLAMQISVITDSRDLFDWCKQWEDRRPESIWAGETDFVLDKLKAILSIPLNGKSSERNSLLEDWWARFNQPFVEQGLEPFEIDSLEETNVQIGFANMRAPQVEDCTVPPQSQPLVSIVIPTYNPDSGLLQAVQSLCLQSWTNLEVIIVDDCSVTGQDFLDEVEASDSRVRVVRAETNGGAYRARNLGLQLAKGEFFTVQDDDDISHSRRVERHAAPLLGDSSLVASISRGQRVGTDGSLTNFGALPHSRNMSSNFVRTELFRSVLGQFDDVRKGSDAELIERMKAAFGDEAVVELPDTLALLHQTAGSLSRSDFRLGWMSGDRVGYTHQYRGKHLQISESETPDWKLSPSRMRCSWAAPRMLGEPMPGVVPYALLGDWTAHLEGPMDSANLVPCLSAESGEAVGLLSGISPRFSLTHRDPVRRTLSERVENGEATWLSWADKTSITTLIVTDPEFLNFIPTSNEIGFTVEQVWILLDQSLRRTDSGLLLPPLRAMEDRVRRAFGVDPVWRVSSSNIAAYLTERGHRVAAPLVAPTQSLSESSRNEGPLTIGIPLPAVRDRVHWDLDEVNSMLPHDVDAEIVLYGELKDNEIERVETRGWTLKSPTTVSKHELLREIDLLLVDPFDEGLISAASWIQKCARSNVALFAPHRYEQEFGPLVVSFRPKGIADLLRLAFYDRPFLQTSVDSSWKEIERKASAGQLGSPLVVEQVIAPSLSFILLGNGSTYDFETTSSSIAEAAAAIGLNFQTWLTPAGDTNALLKTIELILGDGQAGGFVCLMPAGTTITREGLFPFNQAKNDSKVHVFLEGGYEYPLNTSFRPGDFFQLSPSGPLWAGSTSTVYDIHLLREVLLKHPDASDPQVCFAGAISISGCFSVLGYVVSALGHEDQLDTEPEMYSAGWYLTFSLAWEKILADSAGNDAIGKYLATLYYYMLQVRLTNNLGIRNKGALNGEQLSEFLGSTKRALQFVDDRAIVHPPTGLALVGRAIRIWLLKLKHSGSLETNTNSVRQDIVVSSGRMDLEKVSSTQIALEVLDAKAGSLVLMGRFTAAILGDEGTVRLRGHQIDLPVVDVGRYADVPLFGMSVIRYPTFTIEVPLAKVADARELQFMFVPRGGTGEVSIPLSFPKPMSKLSTTPNSYWAVNRTIILRRKPRSITVQRYSLLAVIRAEAGRQLALRRMGGSEAKAAANLRLAYFLRWQRIFRVDRPVWMYADRVTNGGDNGEYAFKFAAQQRDGIKKFYVLRDGTELARSFVARGMSFLSFGSKRQQLAFLRSEIVFATRVAPSNTFGFQRDEQFVRDLFNYRVVYINHGLVVDKLDQVLNRASGNIDTVCVVSEFERRNLVKRSYGYGDNQVVTTGFARFDGLQDRSKRQILLTPTWRAYLHQPQRGDIRSAANEWFVNSAYYRVMNSLLNNARLLEALRVYDYEFVYLLHPNTSSQIDDFEVRSDQIHLVSAAGERTYERLLSESGIMITDYSGVQFDFAFMKKPVLYYHHPDIPPHYAEDSFNYEVNGFGEIAQEEEALVELLIEQMSSGARMTPHYEARVNNFFQYLDTDNSKRIYQVGREVQSRIRNEKG